MSDDISVIFLGPSFYTRLLNSNKRNALLFGMSIGYLGYINDGELIDKFYITGNTAGLLLDFGYDIGISDNLALDFNISLLTGVLNTIQVDNGHETQTIELDKDKYIGLGRVDLSVGLRFNVGR